MRLRALTYEQIEQFANLPNVKKQAVENFLMSVQANQLTIVALVNLVADKCRYKWNDATAKAILAGISLADE